MVTACVFKLSSAAGNMGGHSSATPGFSLLKIGNHLTTVKMRLEQGAKWTSPQLDCKCMLFFQRIKPELHQINDFVQF